MSDLVRSTLIDQSGNPVNLTGDLGKQVQVEVAEATAKAQFEAAKGLLVEASTLANRYRAEQSNYARLAAEASGKAEPIEAAIKALGSGQTRPVMEVLGYVKTEKK